MATTAARSAERWTSADLRDFPNNGLRYEIIDGELFVSKQPDWHHQYAADRACSALNTWSDRSRLGIAVSAPGLIFSNDDDVVPDVIWASWARWRAIAAPDGRLRGAPELVIEVLSPGPANERRDRQVKLTLYERQGVAEYWLIDWRARTVELFRRDAHGLRPAAALTTADTITSPLLPDFACPVALLWEPPVEGE